MTDLLKRSDFAAVPLAIAILFRWAALDGTFLPLLAAGFVLWTLVEYAVHRALHRPRFRAAHMRHHQHPREPVGGTAYTSAAIAAFVAVGACDPAVAPALQGFLAGYLAFLALHAINHHAPRLRRVLPRTMRNHDLHHHGPAHRRYGVTISLWDRLFGTL